MPPKTANTDNVINKVVPFLPSTAAATTTITAAVNMPPQAANVADIIEAVVQASVHGESQSEIQSHRPQACPC
jgi:hypothetical protein